MSCDVARMAGPRVLVERTAATASLVAMRTRVSGLSSRQTIELDPVHHVVQKSSFVTPVDPV